MKKISKTSKKSKISKTSKDNESTNKPRMSSKQERIASKMESILEDLPPDNNTEPNRDGMTIFVHPKVKGSGWRSCVVPKIKFQNRNQGHSRPLNQRL